MDETFYLTNMCPQVGDGFNRDYWSHFEHFCRELTKTYSSVRIVTGPLYLPKKDADGKYRVTYEMIGNPPNVAVPTHFFKIVIGEDPVVPSIPRKGVAVGAFVLPNAPIPNSVPLKNFYVPLDSVERSAGVSFLPLIKPDQTRDLCREVSCEITIREFNKALALPPGQKPLALPSPKS
jgi:endonuclease G